MTSLPFKNILLLYKRSAYKIYFLDNKYSLFKHNRSLTKKELKRFQDAHDEHYASLKAITRVLFTLGIPFTECYRGHDIDYSKYDLIITIGGDGTFLEASRQSHNQVIIGINSAPNHSVGRFCLGTVDDFSHIIHKIQKRIYEIALFHRLQLKVDSNPELLSSLNDILICHSNPAVLCRYYINIKNVIEEQRSSGIWIATPAGSSGAIHSAGGKILNQYSKQFQYLPRELYLGKNESYKLKGSVLSSNTLIRITSLMRNGAIYIDGSHHKLPFEYGMEAEIKLSSKPVKTIRLK